MVNILFIGVSTAWLAVRKLHRIALAKTYSWSISTTISDNSNCHSDGGSIARWLVNPREEIWLIYRKYGDMAEYFYLVANCHRPAWGLLLPDAPRLMLLANNEEVAGVLDVGQSSRQHLEPTDSKTIEHLLEKGENQCW